MMSFVKLIMKLYFVSATGVWSIDCRNMDAFEPGTLCDFTAKQ